MYLNWTSIVALNESFQPWKHPYLGIYPAGVVGPRNVLEGTFSDKKAQNWKKWFSNLSQSLALSTLFLFMIIIFIPYFTNMYLHTQKKIRVFQNMCLVNSQWELSCKANGQKAINLDQKSSKKGTRLTMRTDITVQE